MSIPVQSLVVRLVLPMALLFGSALGCGSTPDPVRFSTEWPTKVGDYDDTTELWTRRGVLRSSLAEHRSQMLELYAIFLSTEWRASFVERQSKIQKMSADRRQQLVDEQRELAAKHHEVELLVSTYHPEQNDLHRDRSIWRVSLIDEAGNEIPALSVEKDRRPRQVVAAEFPRLGDFAEAYRVRFPPTPAIWKGKKFGLRISSSLGNVEVTWKSR